MYTKMLIMLIKINIYIIFYTFDFEVLSFLVGETILESLTVRSLLRDFPLGLL